MLANESLNDTLNNARPKPERFEETTDVGKCGMVGAKRAATAASAGGPSRNAR